MSKLTIDDRAARFIAVDGDMNIEIPGLTAIRIDTHNRVIAVDCVSGMDGSADFRGWALHDLRDGIYGDFHRLKPWDVCNDKECYDVQVQHLDEEDHNEARPENWQKHRPTLGENAVSSPEMQP